MQLKSHQIIIVAAAIVLAACGAASLKPADAPGVIYGQVWSVGLCASCSAKPRKVAVSVTAIRGAWSAQTRSDETGYYRIEVAPGRYRVSTPADGALREAAGEIAVGAGEQKELWLQQTAMRP